MREKPKISDSALPDIPQLHGLLTERETVQFLTEHGFELMTEFVSGQPLLCVMPEIARERIKDAPSIARFDSPQFFNAFLLSNDGGQVDYFTIDASGIPKLMKTDFPARSFAVEKNRIFQVGKSSLFPRGVTK